MKQDSIWEKWGSSTTGRALGYRILDALYPRRCPMCEKLIEVNAGTSADRICASCRKTLPYVKEPLCRRCGKPMKDARKEYCVSCSAHRHAFQEGRSTFIYEGALREAVVRIKFQNRREYIPCFAGEMVRTQEAFLRRVRPDIIVPIPMHPQKRRERGFDQCQLLARSLSRQTGIPAVTDGLIRTRYTKPQKGLKAEDRKENLRSAFAVVRPEMLIGNILLLDDIYTTGSTIDEASRTILRTGNDRIYFLTLCTGADVEEIIKEKRNAR